MRGELASARHAHYIDALVAGPTAERIPDCHRAVHQQGSARCNLAEVGRHLAAFGMGGNSPAGP